MDAFGWLMLGLGGMFFTLGLVAMIGRVSGLPPHEGRGPIALGVGFVLFGISRLPSLPGKEWLTWVGLASVVAGAVLDWRGHRRMRSADKARATDPAQ